MDVEVALKNIDQFDISNDFGLNTMSFGLTKIANEIIWEEFNIRKEWLTELKVEPPTFSLAIPFTKNKMERTYSAICNFHWFANTLYNYLCLTASKLFLITHNLSKQDILSDKKIRQNLNKYRQKFLELVIPELLFWRNKVSSHFASTYPRFDDNLAMLEFVESSVISFQDGRIYAGALNFNSEGESTTFKPWSVSLEMERLSSKFFPHLKLGKPY